MLVTFYFFIPSSYSTSILSPLCVNTHFDETAYVKYVVDGDTIILSDDRHIRLIGINTPELNHEKDKPSEQGAEQAKDVLSQLLIKGTQIKLLYGKERFDKYGRTLAHVYLESGKNIQAEMLKRGLAMPIRIPPNLSQMVCYEISTQLAKDDKRGLWALPRYKTHDVSSLNGSEKGFYHISGQVRQVTESRSSIWLNLENNVALRIHKDDLNYFDKNDLMSLRGSTVEVSGWLYRRKKQLRMRLKHKLDLKVLIRIKVKGTDSLNDLS